MAHAKSNKMDTSKDITPSRILDRLASQVRELRISKGWSQAELAAKAGLHRTSITRIERKKYNVRILVIEHLANALGVSARDLI